MSELVSLHKFKCKYRWTLEGKLPGGDLMPQFVRVNNRPTLTIQEKEISPNVWILGDCEGKWNSTNVTILEASKEFWDAIQPSVCTDNGEIPKLGTFTIRLYDGAGFELEAWELEDAYLKNLEFEEVDHSSSTLNMVNMEIHYEKAKCKTSNLTNRNTLETMGLGTLGNNVKCPKCQHEFNHTIQY